MSRFGRRFHTTWCGDITELERIMMEPTGSAVHVREHRTVLAAAEKRLLVWIAARLPESVSSDQLTCLGLASLAAAGAAFASMRIAPAAAFVVVAALAANWFGDSLDGTLARVRNQPRPRYGFYVDHVLDIGGTAFLLGGMACSGRMSPVVALAALGAYLMVSAESYLATHALGVFRMSFLGFGPTELRMLLAAGALAAMPDPRVAMGPFDAPRLLDFGGVIATAGLFGAFTFNVIRHTSLLYRAEPLPPRAVRAA
jgi:phosphatidylglycerophosphate synthase